VTEELTTTALQNLFSSACTDGDECSRAAALSSAVFVSSDLETPNILMPQEDTES